MLIRIVKPRMHMRYCAEHKAQTRERLLQSSSQLAKQGGFAVTGVDALMKAVGLTGGAFYSHFSSKDELFSSIVERELSNSLSMLGEQASSREKLLRCLNRYLSLEHVQNPALGCALPTLGSEIARAEPAVRECAESWLVHLHKAWSQELGDPQLAWAILAQCVGALVVARMMAHPEQQEQVLSASKKHLKDQLESSK